MVQANSVDEFAEFVGSLWFHSKDGNDYWRDIFNDHYRLQMLVCIWWIEEDFY